MKTINYKEYLRSKKWLLKKNELITTYLKQGWNIKCNYCDDDNNLQVHHSNYKNIGNEILTDERIWDLRFVCRDCHKKIHFEKDWLKNKEEQGIREMFNKI